MVFISKKWFNLPPSQQFLLLPQLKGEISALRGWKISARGGGNFWFPGQRGREKEKKKKAEMKEEWYSTFDYLGSCLPFETLDTEKMWTLNPSKMEKQIWRNEFLFLFRFLLEILFAGSRMAWLSILETLRSSISHAPRSPSLSHPQTGWFLS